MELILEYDCEYGNFDIVDDEEIEFLIEDELKKGGWRRVACLLDGAELNPPYGHRRDGYGNIKDIQFDDIIFWLEEITKA